MKNKVNRALAAKKKFFTFIIAFVATITLANAAIVNGTCGDNLTWSLNTLDSTLTIEGSGEMSGWNYISGNAPWAEYNTYIAYVSLPDGLTSICDCSFVSCPLHSIVIPNTVVKMGHRIFQNCINLSSAIIGDSITFIGSEVFSGCSSLITIDIPNNVTSIGYRAFYNCSNLRSVSIGNKVKSINEEAFKGCTSLSSIKITSSLSTIGKDAFSNCKINEIYYEGNLIDWCNKAWRTRTISGGYNLYINGESLDALIIPNNVTEINDYLFNGCKTLESLVIPDNVINIGEHAFSSCKNLVNVSIGEGEKKFSQYVFSGCTSLPMVDSVRYADTYCVGLWSSNMTSVAIREGTKWIGNGAFAFQWKLKSLRLPSSLVDIGYQAFCGCDQLTNLIVEALTPPSGGRDCCLNNTSCVLYVPAESVEIYANTIWWEDFKEIKAIGGLLKVRFVDWDGSLLSLENVEEGSAATAPADPSREGYTFTGWDKDFSNITEDLTITAQYQINRYKVDFLNWDGTILKSDSVDWNTAAIAPANPSRVGYEFIGWDKEFGNVTDNLVVTAQYELGEKTNYTINFNNRDGDEIISNSIVLKVPAAPEILGFTFIGWRPVASMIESNTIEIMAVYEADEPTSAPSIMTNPANSAQKLIRNGSVYILTDDSRTYTLTGQQVK